VCHHQKQLDSSPRPCRWYDMQCFVEISAQESALRRERTHTPPHQSCTVQDSLVLASDYTVSPVYAVDRNSVGLSESRQSPTPNYCRTRGSRDGYDVQSTVRVYTCSICRFQTTATQHNSLYQRHNDQFCSSNQNEKIVSDLSFLVPWQCWIMPISMTGKFVQVLESLNCPITKYHSRSVPLLAKTPTSVTTTAVTSSRVHWKKEGREMQDWKMRDRLCRESETSM